MRLLKIFMAFTTSCALWHNVEAIDVRKDIAYGDERPEQKLDLYLPEGNATSARPLALVIHGGGWAIGDKATPREIVFCKYLAENGVVAASINYKLIKFEGKTWASKVLEDGWPTNIEDCQKALSFLLGHSSEYGIDSNAVYSVGFSAGAHLALLIGYAQKASWMPPAPASFKGFAGVISCYGTHDLKLFGKENFGRTHEEQAKNIPIASPLTYLTKDSPPTFLTHGGKDTTIKPSVAIDFAKHLEAAGTPYHFWYLPEDVHSFSLDPAHEPLRSEVLKFIKTRSLPSERSADALLNPMAADAGTTK